MPEREPLDLAVLMRLADAATKGPWEQHPDTYAGSVWVTRPFARGNRMIETVLRVAGQVCRVHSDEEYLFRKTPDYPQHEHDAAFIAAAREAVPRLVAALREAMQQVPSTGGVRSSILARHGLVDSADRVREEGA